MPLLKRNFLAFIEILLDILLDFIIPYRILSRTSLKNISFPKWIPYSYVLNQKIQRLQILSILHEMDIKNPVKLKTWWSRGLNNFGDELLPYLLARIAGVECFFDRKKTFISIGSIVRFATDNTTVWGSGIIREHEKTGSASKYLSVRGVLTRENLLSHGADCPEVYGDPAMLFPLFYKPVKQKIEENALIVPHFKHISIIKKQHNYKYLDLRVHSLQDIKRIIDYIVSAPCVVTSSLHGFIFCVAYGIPVTVFKLDKQGIGGDNIKFDDFCSGVGIESVMIHVLNDDDDSELKSLVSHAKVYTPNWSPLPLLESLAKICPTPTLLNFIQKVS